MAGLIALSANAPGMKRLVLLLALALLAPATAQAAPVGVGHSGWFWGNPQPQGNTLRAIEFDGSFGVAAGDFGTLLRTGDGGRSWTAVRSGNRYSNDWDIAIAGSSVLFGGNCYEGRSDDGGLTFKKVPSRCVGNLDVSLPSPLRAFRLTADGSVQRADDGITFTDVGAVPGTFAAGTPAPNDTPSDIFFTDNNTGFAVTVGGFVYRTTDGGVTWFERTKAPTALNAVYFFDGGIGYAVGRDNTVLKTTDGGETWNPKPVPDTIPKGELTSIRCGTSTNCMVTRGIASADRLLHTTNGGNTWTALTPTTEHLYDVAYSSSTDAVAVGDFGTTLLTTNANSNNPNFVRIGEELPGHFVRIRSKSPDLVVASGQAGRLGRSTDGGPHWSTIQLPTSADLRDAWFVDDQVGFALDAGGRVFRTTNGGDNWTEFGTASGVQPSTLYAPDQNTVLLFGPTGVRRGTGGSFDLVGDDVMKGAQISEYDYTGGGVVFAYGRTALFVSRDAGVTWKAVPAPYRTATYRRLDFITRNVGFAVLESGRIYRTGDGGKNWREVLSAGSKAFSGVSFSDVNNGFLVATGRSDRTVLRTTDGGATWHPQLFSDFPLEFGGIVAPDPNIAFATFNGGGRWGRIPSTRLYFTNTGGDLATTPSTLTLMPSRTVVTQRRRVKVTGKLSPGQAGAAVKVYVHDNATRQWRGVFRMSKVKADGTFTASPWIEHTSQLVAQWPGNEKLKGAGSRYVTIRMR
jgi:photosystem II stability/assembly factor-like uncharacterized protein